MPEEDCFKPCASELETAPKLIQKVSVRSVEVVKEKTRFKQKLPIVV